MAPSTNQRVSRPNPGDFTGREKAKQAKEQADALKERGATTTLATQAQSYEEEHGVFDPGSGARIDAHEVEVIDDEDDFEEPSRGFGGGVFDDDDEPVLTGHETDEDLAPILAERAAPKVRRGPARAHSAEVIVRLDQDVDDMTYGIDPISLQPKNYTFKEGLKYKISYDVAEHLNERGLIRQWVTS